MIIEDLLVVGPWSDHLIREITGVVDPYRGYRKHCVSEIARSCLCRRMVSQHYACVATCDYTHHYIQEPTSFDFIRATVYITPLHDYCGDIILRSIYNEVPTLIYILR